MLDALRKGAGSWLAKIFIALLVLSFAVWGIADIFRGFRAQTLAVVGDQEIDAEQYRDAYEREIRAMSARAGRQITTAEARALQLPRQVLTRLVAGAALDSHAAELGIGISDEVIADSIRADRAFQDSSGKFSKIIFQQLLHANGLTEAEYVNRQRNELVRAQLIETMSESPVVPKALMDAANRYQNETRVIEYFVLPVSAAGKIAEPDEAKLKAYYDAHIGRFTAPEYRKIGALAISPETLAKQIEVSQEDLEAAYEANRDRFETPERRTMEQIIFKDMETARTAYEKLKKGGDFLESAKAQGMSEADIKLGPFARKDMSDEKIAEVAFKLKKGEISEPVEGTFSTVILRVTDIKPGKTKSFDEVKDELRSQLAKQRASEELLDMHDKIEDERAAGSTLEEIAQKFKLKHVTATLDRRGNTPEGKPDKTLPHPAKFLDGVFESDVGVENDPVETDDDGYVWFDVLEVIPAAKKPLDEVRDEVRKAWQADELKKTLRKKADELVEKARGGTPLADLAKEVTAKPETSVPLKRGGSEKNLPSAAVAQAFTLPEGGVGSAATADDKSRVIFKVLKITPPEEIKTAFEEKLREALKKSIGDDLAAQYIVGLQQKFGVEINNEAFTRLFGQ